MKYWIDTRGDFKNWKLMRYDEVAGAKLPNPGEFDNAHLEFWERIQELEVALRLIQRTADQQLP